MLGFERRELALDLENVVVGIGAGEEIEDVGDARERLPRGLQCIDGVGEGRRRAIRCDRRHLARVLREGVRESRHEMPRPDAGERRHAERADPILQQRIIAWRRVHGCFFHARHMGLRDWSGNTRQDVADGISPAAGLLGFLPL